MKGAKHDQLLGCVAAAALVLAVGCRRASPRPTQDAPASPPPGQPSAAPKTGALPSSSPASGGADPDAAADGGAAPLPPLASTRRLIELEVQGYRDAVASIPHGATNKRPVVVALHGNYDRPEWQCDVWREALEAKFFILCPRGIPRGDAPKSEDRWTYGSMKALQEEIMTAMQALAERYPKHVDLQRPVLIGFSLGAILATHLLAKDEFPFRRMVLIEGGYESWSAKRARALADGGRVLFACGQAACRASSTRAARVMKAAGLETRVELGGNVGHTYDGPVAAAVQTHWNWLVAGDSRFTLGR